MNVPEITILYETLRTVIKHFEASTKSKEILDQIQIHLISRRQTWIGHFLKACSVANDTLPAIYDVMAICNIRQDERDSLFTAQSVYLLKLMSFFEPSFMGTYLRSSDKSNLLVRH